MGPRGFVRTSDAKAEVTCCQLLGHTSQAIGLPRKESDSPSGRLLRIQSTALVDVFRVGVDQSDQPALRIDKLQQGVVIIAVIAARRSRYCCFVCKSSRAAFSRFLRSSGLSVLAPPPESFGSSRGWRRPSGFPPARRVETASRRSPGCGPRRCAGNRTGREACRAVLRSNWPMVSVNPTATFSRVLLKCCLSFSKRSPASFKSCSAVSIGFDSDCRSSANRVFSAASDRSKGWASTCIFRAAARVRSASSRRARSSDSVSRFTRSSPAAICCANKSRFSLKSSTASSAS